MPRSTALVRIAVVRVAPAPLALRRDRLRSQTELGSAAPRQLEAGRGSAAQLRSRAPLWAGALLLAVGSFLASAPAQAFDPAATTEPPAAAEQSSTRWGPIVGACFGVLFGGALALWQVRSMKRRS